MKAVLHLTLVLVLASCGPTKRFDQDLQGREKPTALWYRMDVSHVRRTIPASLDAVWSALPASFESLQFPGRPTVYAADHIYVTPQLKVERRLYEGESNSLYLDCGRTLAGQPIADEYQVIFSVMARLTPKPDNQTEIDIIVDGTAQDLKERSLPVRCNGTGRFEDAVVDKLLAAVRSGD
jgi:hypothetical protein